MVLIIIMVLVLVVAVEFPWNVMPKENVIKRCWFSKLSTVNLMMYTHTKLTRKKCLQ